MYEKNKVFNVFNFHITHQCNYNCVYCFCNFKDKPLLSLESACKIVDNIAQFFKENSIQDGRINLAGGEPLLYPFIDKLIEYIHQKGLEISIITNGSLLTAEKIESWKDKVSCIGLSIDSAREKIRNRIGRASTKSMTNQQILTLCEAIKQSGIILKINTVVSKFNVEENMVDFFKELNPSKIKFFKMELVKGINDQAEELTISNKEFAAFKERNDKFGKRKTVFEGDHDMENSYLMINAKGEFILNNNGRYEVYGNCVEGKLMDIISKAPIDLDRFSKRYANKEQPYYAERNICIIGGHPTWLKSIKKYFSNVFYMPKDDITSKEKLSKCDIFWFKMNALSHSLFYKILDIARDNHIPYKCFSFDGAKSCAQQIIEYEENLKTQKILR